MFLTEEELTVTRSLSVALLVSGDAQGTDLSAALEELSRPQPFRDKPRGYCERRDRRRCESLDTSAGGVPEGDLVGCEGGKLGAV